MSVRALPAFKYFTRAFSPLKDAMASYQNGKYTKIRDLGRGAFGRVEEVRRAKDGTHLAMKVSLAAMGVGIGGLC